MKNLRTEVKTENFNLKSNSQCVQFTNKYFIDSSFIAEPLAEMFKRFNIDSVVNISDVERLTLDQALSCTVKVMTVDGEEEPIFHFSCRGVIIGKTVVNLNLSYTCYQDDNTICINGLGYSDVDKYADRVMEGFNNPGFYNLTISYGKLSLHVVKCGINR